MARLLVVDDEEGVRSYLADALDLSGHDVDTAADGAEALALVEKRSYHVVLTDLKMPHVDGMSLLKTVRTQHPEMEVVMLTAHGDVESAVKAMKLGAFDFLQKPIPSPTVLRRVVERAVDHHRLTARTEVARRPRATQDGGPVLTWGAPVMAPVVRALKKVAATDATVLIQGESGTGKEVSARAVHAWSKRAAGPFVAVNCAALSENLLESELFGHEKGSFTGATARKRGRVELAEGGTFFLDEVGELKPDLQAKLLRVLQERTFERVGGTQTVQADVRWVAATNRDLAQLVSEGRFREDLYYRLAVFPVALPPLRERPEDLAPMADTLLGSIREELGRARLEISPGARQALAARSWRGNVRELRNALERAAILADGDIITAADLGGGPLGPRPPGSAAAPALGGTLEDLEKAAITSALARHDGHRRKAAEQLGIGERTLYDKIKRYGL
jgi:two-component system, NtrC family, response regulator AtoC